MSKLFNKAIIEDVVNVNNSCSHAERENMLDIFQYVMKRSGLERKAWFDLKDFVFSARELRAGFTLMIERKTIDGKDHWMGAFEDGHKRLEVMGTLEKA